MIHITLIQCAYHRKDTSKIYAPPTVTEKACKHLGFYDPQIENCVYFSLNNGK